MSAHDHQPYETGATTKKLTLEDVGRLAGVSRATVSRVLNRPQSVTPELRARVERVIEQTGYKPNLAARSLASQRSNIIGLIIPSVAQTLFTDPYFSVLIQGISQACNAIDYTLSLFLFHSIEEQRQIFQRATGTGLIDGLIVTADKLNDPYIERLMAQNIAFVYVGRPVEGTNASFVDVDNVAGSHNAVNHLLRLGYERIATISGPPNTSVGIDRRAGYLNALRERQRPVDDSLIAYGDFSRQSGFTAMRQLLPHCPDAVFVSTDTMAAGAMQALAEADRRVPDDIAVVGFDDLPPALDIKPHLTTVRQPIQRTGQMAVELLIDILNNGPEPPRRVILPTELIIRATCGAMPPHPAADR